jgi:hypothetical protein
MHACKFVSMYGCVMCTYARMYVYVHEGEYICTHVCMHTRARARVHTQTYAKYI